MTCAAFHGLHGQPVGFDGFTILPGSSADPWALDLLPAHYQAAKADLLVTLMDAWVLDPAKLAGMNIAHWLPVDCTPLSAMDRNVLEKAGGRPVAMSEFGRRQLEAAGFDPLYAPHALFCDTWKPLPDRQSAKDAVKLGDGSSLGDRFVIGVNAANQDPWRKGFAEQFMAFAKFSREHDDAVMLVHSRAEHPQGVNLPELIRQLGMENRIILGDQYPIAAGLIGEPQMVSWHGYCDVLSNCAYGEGFGLAVLQSQATGTPVVVSDNSAMTELCGAGWAVECQPWFNRGHSSFWGCPSVPAIADAYEQAYEKAGSLREQAREFALNYDAPKVAEECWKPILAELIPVRAA